FYYSDRKGDPLSVQYGGMHSCDMPKYHSACSAILCIHDSHFLAGRHILGLPPSFSAFRTSHGIEVG
ncbi:hypothetical protein DFH08DRAFT_1012717, partial [Mycena albidolilacea]